MNGKASSEQSVSLTDAENWLLDDTRTALAGDRGAQVRESVRLEVPLADVYRFWRRLEHLHLSSVTETSERRSTQISVNVQYSPPAGKAGARQGRHATMSKPFAIVSGVVAEQHRKTAESGSADETDE